MLLQFRTDAGRDPQPQRYAEDCERLLSIRGGLPGAGVLPDTFVGCVGQGGGYWGPRGDGEG